MSNTMVGRAQPQPARPPEPPACTPPHPVRSKQLDQHGARCPGALLLGIVRKAQQLLQHSAPHFGAAVQQPLHRAPARCD